MGIPLKKPGLVQTAVKSAALAAFLIAGAQAASAAAQEGAQSRNVPATAEIKALDEGAIIKRVRADGYKDLSIPALQGDVYRLEATDKHGMRVNLTVDAVHGFVRGGQILGRVTTPPAGLPPGRDAERITPAPIDAAAARSPDLPVAGVTTIAPRTDPSTAAKARAAAARQARLNRQRIQQAAIQTPPQRSIIVPVTTSSTRRHYFLPMGD